MSENEQSKNQDYEQDKPAPASGFPSAVVAMMVVFFGLAGFFIGDSRQSKVDIQRVAELQCVKAQAEANKAVAEMQAQTQKRMAQIQDKVATECSNHGLVPQFQGGNVFCPITK